MKFNKQALHTISGALLVVVILVWFNLSQRKPELVVERDFNEHLLSAQQNQKEIEIALSFRPSKESFSLNDDVSLEKRLRIASLAFESGLVKLNKDTQQPYVLNILFGEKVFTSYFSREDIELSLQRKIFFKLFETFINKKLP